MDSTFFSLDEVSSVEWSAVACVCRVHRLNAFDLYLWMFHVVLFVQLAMTYGMMIQGLCGDR